VFTISGFQRIALLISAIMTLGGCLVIPLEPFTDEPYPAAILTKLASRTTDRDEVRRALGPPVTTRLGDSYWFYGREIPVAGILGGTSSVVITREEWLAIEFDDSGRVSFLGHGRSKDACLANGICKYWGALLKQAAAYALVTAPELHDAEAKAFIPQDQCAVYFFWEPAGVKKMSGFVILSVDGREHGVSDYRTYHFFTHAPGSMHIQARKIAEEIDCQAGEKVYIKGMDSWEKPWGAAIVREDAAAGEAEIRNRRLALSR
jgi:hypothetical protein